MKVFLFIRDHLSLILNEYQQVTKGWYNMNAIDKITSEILQHVEAVTLKPIKTHSKKKKRAVELTGRHYVLTRKKISRSLTGRTLSDEHKEAISQAMSQAWQVTSPTGKNHLVYNLKAFCLKKGLNYSAMVNVSTGILNNTGEVGPVNGQIDAIRFHSQLIFFRPDLNLQKKNNVNQDQTPDKKKQAPLKITERPIFPRSNTTDFNWLFFSQWMLQSTLFTGY